MPGARRVQLIPPAGWDEDALLAAARALIVKATPVRPGDAVGDLVVVAVDPAPGESMQEDTAVEILPTPPHADAAQVDIVVLLDVSESMSVPWDVDHTRLAAARRALTSFLAQPGAAVASVTLFEYAREPILIAGPAPPRDVKLPAAREPKGRSATAVAMNAAIAHLAARVGEGHAQVILLVTDGVGDVKDLLVAAGRAARLRIPVHSVVFAPEIDEAFDDLADTTGGSAQMAAHPLTIEFEHEPGGE